MRRVRDSRRGSFGGFESEACLRDRDRGCVMWGLGLADFVDFTSFLFGG